MVQPYVQRYVKLASIFPDVPNLEVAKATRAPIHRGMRMTFRKLQLVHLDSSGKITTKSFGERSYEVGFVDDFTRKNRLLIRQRE